MDNGGFVKEGAAMEDTTTNAEKAYNGSAAAKGGTEAGASEVGAVQATEDVETSHDGYGQYLDDPGMTWGPCKEPMEEEMEADLERQMAKLREKERKKNGTIKCAKIV